MKKPSITTLRRTIYVCEECKKEFANPDQARACKARHRKEKKFRVMVRRYKDIQAKVRQACPCTNYEVLGERQTVDQTDSPCTEYVKRCRECDKTWTDFSR